jgi:phage terminase large subunit
VAVSKSWAGRRKALLLALNTDLAGMQILFIRRRYNDVYENHIFPLSLELNKFFKFKGDTKSFDFPWGSRIIFGYCDHEKDILNYQGKAYDCIFVEEATQFTPFMLQSLTESLRPSGFMKSYHNWNPRMYYTMNPGGVGHAYIKRLFIDKSYERKERPENYSFVPSTVFENAFIMDNDPSYVESLENLPEQRRKAMLYGDWDVYEGQFFTDWRDNPDGYFNRKYTHVIDDFPIPETWKRYRVMDWGYSKPFSVGWYAVNQDDVVFRYREYYGCTGEPDVGLRMTPEQVADEVKRIEKELEPRGVYIEGVADPAIFSSDTGKSIAESFEDKGIYFERADNSRLTGWNQMRERMKFDTEGCSMLYIFKSNRHFIRTIPSLIHDATKVEDLDTKQEDHIADECRYFCMSRPVKNRIIAPPKPHIFNPLESNPVQVSHGLGLYVRG